MTVGKEVGQLFNDVVKCGNFDIIFAPFLTGFSTLHHPTRAVWCTPLSAVAYRLLTGC